MAHFFFDFDSTIITVESIDLVIEDSLKEHSNCKEIVAQITQLTEQAMNGEIDFVTASENRWKILPLLTFQSFKNAGEKLLQFITPGIEKAINYLHNNHQVNIISGGYAPCIEAVAKKLNIAPQNCYANQIIIDSEGLLGPDKKNLLWSNSGKSNVILKLKKQMFGKIILIGDGNNDLEAKEKKAVDLFVGFGVNKHRTIVEKKADFFCKRADELLPILKTIEERML